MSMRRWHNWQTITVHMSLVTSTQSKDRTMKHKSYQILKRAYLGAVDLKALASVRQTETDPFVHRMVDLTTSMGSFRVPWESKVFKSQFLSGSPRERMDETVVTFLLRLAAIVKDDTIFRSFRKPASSHVVLAWSDLLKESIISVLTLLYGVRWSTSKILLLNRAVLDLVSEGRSNALRQLMEGVGIRLSSKQPYKAEEAFETLSFLHTGQFGSFYWRLLHWMAEAVQVRSDDEEMFRLAKTIWRRLVTGPLYRTLLCNICKFHMQQLIQELKPQLLDESIDYARLWYSIHNRVNTIRIHDDKIIYPEEDYKKDAAFMLQALVP